MKPDRFRLRVIEETDLPTVLTWRNSERIRANMFTDHLISMDEHLAWFNRLKSQGEDFVLIFEFNEHAAGLVQFNLIDSSSREYAWGFYVGEGNLPRGTGLIMGLLGLNFAFEKLNVLYLRGGVLASNIPSLNFHNKLGFTEVNRSLRQKSGKNEETINFLLARENWLLSKESIEVLKYLNPGHS